MPANLTQQYYSAEKRYKQAHGPEEKLAALQEMLSVIPKHKGTEHLQADIRRRLSQLKKEGSKKGGGGKRTVSPYAIPRAEAGQVVVIGPPNSGKSSLVGALSKAPVTIAEYPFSTTLPVPGIMAFDDVRIQIVDTPPILAGSCDPELAQLLGRTDLVVLALSASDPEVLEQLNMIENELRRHGIGLVADPEQAEELLTVGGAVKTLVIATGIDREGGPEGMVLLREVISERLPVLHVVPQLEEGLTEFCWECWHRLGAIRVFCKQPGKKADMDEPFFLTESSTVLDLAFRIHKDLGRNLKLARLWGEGVHDGQPVHREHVLHDGDIVELRE